MSDQARTTRDVSALEVLGFVARYWRALPVSLSLIIAGALASVMLEVQIPAFAADLVISVQAFMNGEVKVEAAWRAVFLLLCIFFLRFAIQHLYLRLWMYFASRVMYQMVNDGFERVQRFSSDWHANNFAGSTVRKITRAMWAYDTLADTIILELGPAFVLLGSFSVAMYMRDPAMGLYFATTSAIFLGVTVAVSLGYVAPANVRSNEADTELGGALADSVTCNSVVKSFGAEAREDALLESASMHWRLSARRAWLRSMDAGALQSLLILCMLGGLLTVVLWRAGEASVRVEDVVYVITTYFIVNGYLRNIGWQVRNMQRSINELDDLVEVSQTAPQVADKPGARPFQAGAGHIAFRQVGFRYANQPAALFTDFSVEIAAGEKVALVGESGAGKTTFVKLVQRLYDVDSGSIVIDGQDIADVQQESLRAAISLVPQEPILFHRTLAENISYGRPGASFEAIEQAARQAHAHDFIDRLTEGYDTLVGERGIKLSGGERQRVAIARAILADQPILILDEATSSLDSVTEHLIQDAIASLMEGRTAIVIAHRLSTIRAADRILVFDQGRIVEEGSHDALMAKADGIYTGGLFDMQSLGFIDVDDAAAETVEG